MHRRSLIAATASLGFGLAGCASAPPPPANAAGADESGPARLTRSRSLGGGFLARPTPGLGLPAGPSGMFVKWISPGPLALRAGELVVADLGTSRLWRVDAVTDALIGIPGAPVAPGIALALGPDLSCWLLDTAGRQMIRFARDGRLLQQWRVPTALAAPSGLALADGGGTLLLADSGLAQWAELRSPGGPIRTLLPQRAEGTRIASVQALAIGRDGQVFVLDRLAGVVHLADRDGRVARSLGRGELTQPAAMAVDAADRVFVLDAQGRSLTGLRVGQPTQRWSADEIGATRIAGIAADESILAITDPLAAQVILHRIALSG